MAEAICDREAGHEGWHNESSTNAAWQRRPQFRHDPEFLAWAGFNFFRHLGPSFGPLAAQAALEGVLMERMLAGQMKGVPTFKATFQPVPMKEANQS